MHGAEKTVDRVQQIQSEEGSSPAAVQLPRHSEQRREWRVDKATNKSQLISACYCGMTCSVSFLFAVTELQFTSVLGF